MKNFIVVGTQRTGSSVIAEYLGLHPEVTCGWEWTLNNPRYKKFKIVERALTSDFSFLSAEDQKHLANIHNIGKSWIGFRWLFSSSNKWLLHPRYSFALWLDCLEKFIKWSSSRSDIHIIHVIRNDRIDWLKSVYLAKRVKIYSKKKYPEGIKVKIPIREAIYRIRAKKWVDLRLSKLRHTNPYHLINYEDFLSNQNTVIIKGLRFIKCKHTLQKTTTGILRKQSNKKASDYILNYDDLIESLSKENLLDSSYKVIDIY